VVDIHDPSNNLNSIAFGLCVLSLDGLSVFHLEKWTRGGQNNI